MENKERLKFCSKCQKRDFDLNKGITCSLTGEKPQFEDECPDFVRDENVKDEPIIDVSEDLEPAEVIQNLDSDVYEKLKLDQNFPVGIIGGIVAGIVCAILWAIISLVTNFQIGFMAVGVGLAVGFSIRLLGRGVEKIFGYAGAVISLLSCVLGNFLMIVGFISKEIELGFWETLKIIDLAYVPEMMIANFDFIDLLFYGLALAAGYKYAFRKVTEQDIVSLQ